MNAPVDVTNTRIETDRLILRAWREDDLEDLYEYAKVDGVGQMAGWRPHESIEKSREILEHFIGEKKTFALELKENGKVIGSLGLESREPDEPGKGFDVDPGLLGREIGYVLSKDYWGRGLMPEAVKAVIDHCFRELRFDYLTCGHYTFNKQSRRVIEKSGFSFLKDIQHETRLGTTEPTKLYILYNPRKMTAPFDAGAVQLETDRLLLRPIREGDLQDLHEIATVPEIADVSGFAASETLEDTRKFLERHIQDNETLALVLKENGKMIGTFSVQPRYWEEYPLDRTLRGREFGFDLNKAYWGRGLMPEALRAVTAYCLDTLSYDFVTCGHFLRNSRSSRVIEKSGFAFLFEAEHTMPTGVKERIRTYIIYKEKQPCLNG